MLIVLTTVSTIVLVFWIPWRVATEVGKKVDFSQLQQSLSEFRKVDIKELQDTMSEFKKVDIKNLSDKMEDVLRGLRRTESNIKTTVDAINRDIIRVINQEHKEIHGELDKIKLSYQSVRESLTSYHQKTLVALANFAPVEVNEKFQQAVWTKIDSLKDSVASLKGSIMASTELFGTGPFVSTEPFEIIEQFFSRIDSLTARINLLQKSFDEINKIDEERMTTKK